jgi:ketose-bisphosphate aldolase
MKDLVDRAYKEGYAVPAFCTWNAETMQVILSVAERLKAPVILMHGPSEFALMQPAAMAEVARAIEGLHHATAALHLDHGDTMDMVRQCIASRYTSVMLDFSTRTFDENAAALQEVVRLARPHGITVEGEIGRVGKADESSGEPGAASTLTDPRDAARYARLTGVDLLAVSVGNKHGFYTGEPHLEFGLLAELHAAVPVPLVMHGGTGIPEKDIEKSIGLGIAKVNVASEIVHGFRANVTEQWAKGMNLWTPLAFAHALPSVEPVVERWIRVTGAAGKA